MVRLVPGGCGWLDLLDLVELFVPLDGVLLPVDEPEAMAGIGVVGGTTGLAATGGSTLGACLGITNDGIVKLTSSCETTGGGFGICGCGGGG